MGNTTHAGQERELRDIEKALSLARESYVHQVGLARAELKLQEAQQEQQEQLSRLGDVICLLQNILYAAQQAARRAPEAPQSNLEEPHQIKEAAKLRDLHAYQEAEAIEAAVDAMAELAVQNLCPENLAAPVQLPDPIGYIGKHGNYRSAREHAELLSWCTESQRQGVIDSSDPVYSGKALAAVLSTK